MSSEANRSNTERVNTAIQLSMVAQPDGQDTGLSKERLWIWFLVHAVSPPHPLFFLFFFFFLPLLFFFFFFFFSVCEGGGSVLAQKTKKNKKNKGPEDHTVKIRQQWKIKSVNIQLLQLNRLGSRRSTGVNGFPWGRLFKYPRGKSHRGQSNCTMLQRLVP